jgi:predicted RNA binding protein YcfA (HicA-like mRNA interferase family)
MSRLRPIPQRKLIRILERLGFVKIRQRGSHAFYKHQDGRGTVVPIHSNEEIGVGLLKEILKEAELSREEYQRLL